MPSKVDTSEERAPLIAISGATDKSQLITRLVPILDEFFAREFKVMPALDQMLATVGVDFGSPISGEDFWALEGTCVSFEQRFQKEPKLICTTPLDRFAYCNLSNLNMDAYFNRQVPAFVKDCDLLFLDILGEGQTEFRGRLNSEMRTSEYQWGQVLVGDIDTKVTVIRESLRLHFGDKR